MRIVCLAFVVFLFGCPVERAKILDFSASDNLCLVAEKSPAANEGALSCYAIGYSRPSDEKLTPNLVDQYQSVKKSLSQVCALTSGGQFSCKGKLTPAPPTEQVVRYALSANIGCAILSSKEVRCWLPKADDDNIIETINLQLTAINQKRTIEQMAFGYAQACFLFEDKKAACYSLSSSDGKSSPISGVPDESWAEITIGGYSACGINLDGKILCWDISGSGSKLIPFVPKEGSYTHISLASSVLENVACATTTNAEVHCFGDPNSNVVKKAPTGKGYDQVSVGPGYACARNGNNRLDCWGGKPAEGFSFNIIVDSNQNATVTVIEGTIK